MDIELLLEAERRGILPEDKVGLLAEARRRGLVPEVSGEANVAQQPDAADTTLFEQGASGLNEGLAGLFGAPVDLATGAINAGVRGVNRVAGTEIPEIEDPVLGRGTFENGLRSIGAITETEPQTTGQRYARRVGQEVGFGAPLALATGGASAAVNTGKVLAANSTADIAAGVAGQTAREIAPDNNVLDLVASVLAGGGVAAARGGSMKARPDAPHKSAEDLFEAGKAAYKRADESGVQLTQEAQQGLFDALYGRLKSERATSRRHPRAFDAVEEARNWPNASLSDLEETRSIIGRDVASNADEAAVGVALRQEIDDYLKSIDVTKTTGANPKQAIDDAREGRRLTHQGHKAQAVQGKQYRAQTRAASSGTGGNEVNATRQNIRSILDNEVAPTRSGRGSGYTPDEIAQMEKIVFGTRGQNILRGASRFAPSAGALQGFMMGGGGMTGLALGAATGNPLTMALAVPGVAAEGAKRLAERGTKREIEGLMDIIMRGGVAVPKEVTETGRAVQATGLLSALDSLLQQGNR